MDLRKLPPSMVLALGLACGGDDDDSGSVGPCLDVDPTASSNSATDSATSTSSASTSDTDSGTGSTSAGTDSVGPCLDTVPTTGPCLTPELPSTGAGTDSETDTGSTGDDTTGGAGAALDRSEAIERFSDALPADVLSRLRARGQKAGE